jgi:hypothetical protein
MAQSKSDEKNTREKTNIVWLAGTLKLDPRVYDNNVKALVDVGLKSCIQISVYTGSDSNAELAGKLKRFKAGDFIKLNAMIRPYGVKQDDDTFKNSVSIDVTEIKNDPPVRRQARQEESDDDRPF